MAKVTTNQYYKINSEMDGMRYHFPAEATFDIGKFRSLFWDEETCTLVDEVENKIDHRSMGDYFAAAMPEEIVEVPDGMPVEEGVVGLNVSIYVTIKHKQLMPPIKSGFRRDAPKELEQEYNALRDEVVREALDLRLWKEVMAIHRLCKSHEAMRYLFPGYLYILRRAGMDQIASQIETIKRVPRLPDLSPYQRQVLKYMNEWFATQMLLGTFEGKRGGTKPDRAKVNLSVFSMSDTHAEDPSLQDGVGGQG